MPCLSCLAGLLSGSHGGNLSLMNAVMLHVSILFCPSPAPIQDRLFLLVLDLTMIARLKYVCQNSVIQENNKIVMWVSARTNTKCLYFFLHINFISSNCCINIEINSMHLRGIIMNVNNTFPVTCVIYFLTEIIHSYGGEYIGILFLFGFCDSPRE